MNDYEIEEKQEKIIETKDMGQQTDENNKDIIDFYDSDDEKYVKYLSYYQPINGFPKSIMYPNQKNYEINKETNEQNITKTNYKNIKYTLEYHSTIDFGNIIIYDLSIEGNLLLVVGGEYLKIYNIEEKFKLISSNIIKSETLYCISTQSSENSLIASIGGKNCIIRIINILENKEINQLIGNKNEIYSIKFSCKDKNILLSGSKDITIRLWNIISGKQICIFGGPQSHIAEILSMDWHLTGNYIVSSGIDNSIKIWDLSIPKIKERIEQSFKNDNFKTLIKTRPIFSCNSIHDNYIDCVKFNGNFIISKSVTGVIREWLPIFNPEGDSFYIINTYCYEINDKIWYVKFLFDEEKKFIVVGNDLGNIYLFKTENENDVSDKDYVLPNTKFDLKQDLVVRTIGFSNHYNFFVFGANNGDIIISKLNETN